MMLIEDCNIANPPLVRRAASVANAVPDHAHVLSEAILMDVLKTRKAYVALLTVTSTLSCSNHLLDSERRIVDDSMLNASRRFKDELLKKFTPEHLHELELARVMENELMLRPCEKRPPITVEFMMRKRLDLLSSIDPLEMRNAAKYELASERIVSLTSRIELPPMREM